MPSRVKRAPSPVTASLNDARTVFALPSAFQGGHSAHGCVFTEAMLGYWSRFSRTGQPRAASEPGWPAYGPTGAYMAFRETRQPAAHLFPGMYALHD